MEHYALCVAFYTKAQIAFIMAALLYEFLPETFLPMFSEVFHREEIDRQLFLLHDYSLVQVEMRRIFSLAEKQKLRQLWTWNVSRANWFRNSLVKKRRGKRENALHYYFCNFAIHTINFRNWTSKNKQNLVPQNKWVDTQQTFYQQKSQFEKNRQMQRGSFIQIFWTRVCYISIVWRNPRISFVYKIHKN